MKKLIFVIPLILAGCAPQRSIDALAIRGTTRDVTSLHDKMIRGEVDPSTMTTEDKNMHLRSSELLSKTVETAAGN
jgi:hypothetical protein